MKNAAGMPNNVSSFICAKFWLGFVESEVEIQKSNLDMLQKNKFWGLNL